MISYNLFTNRHRTTNESTGETPKFKVGDLVRISSRSWEDVTIQYPENITNIGRTNFEDMRRTLSGMVGTVKNAQSHFVNVTFPGVDHFTYARDNPQSFNPFTSGDGHFLECELEPAEPVYKGRRHRDRH